ncbi:MAG TPA: hypothetical protein VFA77_08710 [Candidatus Eisenbacteria bacterium]|nr:hypothetical protein [Candidatus Eisenbacteria bacterium]
MPQKPFRITGRFVLDAFRAILTWKARINLTSRVAPGLVFAVLLSMIANVGAAPSAEGLTIAWTNNHLTVAGPKLPGNTLDIWYLEAFCRSNSTHQIWGKTTIPHKTELVSASPTQLRFRTTVSTSVEMLHQVTARRDELDFTFEIKNLSAAPVDLEWFQPACIRVDRFTGKNQNTFIARSFIFTEQGLTTLDKTRRHEEAIYHGGQVYVPSGINLSNVNPRPLSETRPVNGLIGCFSADNQYLFATASDKTHELFEGINVCLHSDPHVGGLGPHETKKIRSKVYIMFNDPQELLKKYRRDFPSASQKE